LNIHMDDETHCNLCVDDQKELILSPCMFGVFLRCYW